MPAGAAASAAAVISAVKVMARVDVDRRQRRVKTRTHGTKVHEAARSAERRHGRSRQAGDAAAEPGHREGALLVMLAVLTPFIVTPAASGRIAPASDVDRSVVQRAVAGGRPGSLQIVTGIERVGQAQ